MAVVKCFQAIPYATGSYIDRVDSAISTAAIPTREPAIIAGVNGLPALNFDGTDDVIAKIVDADLNFQKAFICTCMVNLDVLKNYNYVAGRQDSTDYNFDVYIGINGEIVVRLRNSAGSPGTFITANGLIKVGQFHVISVSWSAENAASSLKVFVDGVSRYTYNPTFTDLSSSLGYLFSIGAYQGSSVSAIDGKVQYVEILKDDDTTGHILTDAEVADLNKALRRRLYLPDMNYISYLDTYATGAIKDRINDTIYTQSTPAYQPSLVGAMNGRYALHFDGSDDRIEIPKSRFNWMHQGNAFDFSCWYKLDNPKHDTFMTVFDTGSASSSLIGVGISFDDRSSVSRSRRVLMGVNWGVLYQGDSVITADNAYPNDTFWHYLKLRYDPTQSTANTRWQLFIDGMQVAIPTVVYSGSSYSMGDSSYNLNIGRSGNAVGYLAGSLFDMKIADTANASITEIASEAKTLRRRRD